MNLFEQISFGFKSRTRDNIVEAAKTGNYKKVGKLLKSRRIDKWARNDALGAAVETWTPHTQSRTLDLLVDASIKHKDALDPSIAIKAIKAGDTAMVDKLQPACRDSWGMLIIAAIFNGSRMQNI